ncbi:MAG: DUF4974 domain-containing protein [Cytophagales bacterium]|nr:DUF4974 domain-containing protein [Cytophagales bacterium]
MGEKEKNIPWDEIHNHLRSDEGKVSPELGSWIKEDKRNEEFVDEIKTIHKLTKGTSRSFHPDKEKAWYRIKNRIQLPKGKVRLIRIVQKVAASIALIIVGLSIPFLLKTNDSENITNFFVPKGNKSQVVLPDGSKVYLNGGSTLSYNEAFTDQREVVLTGEAMFDVKKGDNIFHVNTENIDVQVYGTRFNVKAYPTDSDVEISLVEGSIGLTRNGKTLERMSPGQIAVLNKETDKLVKASGDVLRVISWTRNELIFENQTFEEIVTYLERWYGVEIELEESLKFKHRLTFTVKTESIRELLDLISVMTPIEYNVDGMKVIIKKKK